jgi:hypothetical protein
MAIVSTILVRKTVIDHPEPQHVCRGTPEDPCKFCGSTTGSRTKTSAARCDVARVCQDLAKQEPNIVKSWFQFSDSYLAIAINFGKTSADRCTMLSRPIRPYSESAASKGEWRIEHEWRPDQLHKIADSGHLCGGSGPLLQDYPL